MNARIRELRDERQKAVEESRKILDTAKEEKRDLNDEENQKWDSLMTRQQNLADQIKREERQIELDREFAEHEARAKDNEREREKGKPQSKEDLQMEGFRHWLATGQFRNDDAGQEFRALSAETDTEGGFTVPEQFSNSLIKSIDDLTFIRQRATTISLTSGDSIGVPTLDADPADADWTSELGTGSEDSDMKFGKREMKPYPLAKRIKVSRKLLRVSALGMEQLIRDRLAYKFGITHEKAFLTGHGNNQPLGLFTASNDGIPTSRDVSSGNETTNITFDGLAETKYSLKAAYRNRAEWLFHRDAVKKAAKLKDGEGQYLWQPSKSADEPDLLLGRPLLESEYVPNTFTTGQYVGLFGDLSYYWIADSLMMDMQRLVELYSETNQIGFIGRLESDGAPVLAEAFARIKLA